MYLLPDGLESPPAGGWPALKHWDSGMRFVYSNITHLPMLTEGSEICWGYVHDRMLDGTPKDVANPGRPADSPLGMRIRKKKRKLSEFRSIKSISYWQFSQFGPVRERERGLGSCSRCGRSGE